VLPGLRRPFEWHGLDSRLQYLLLAFGGSLLRPFGLRGFGRLSRLLGRFFDEENAVDLAVHGGWTLRVRLADYYWSHLLFRSWRYEPELEALFGRLLDNRWAFLDCGANIGFWSVLAAARIGDPGRVLAVEAGAATFRRLLENRRLNGDAFTACHAAVTEEAGVHVRFLTNGDRHAGAHVLAEGETAKPADRLEEVDTTTVDRLCAVMLPGDLDRLLLIKLDIEGAEPAALRGAEDTLARRPVLLVYEDHGRDRSCAVSELAMGELGLAVFRCEADGSLTPMASLDEVRASKPDRRLGYNFAACRPDGPVAAELRRLSAGGA